MVLQKLLKAYGWPSLVTRVIGPYLSGLATLIIVSVLLSSCFQQPEPEPELILLGTHIGGRGSSYYTIQPDSTHLRLIHQIPTENLMPVLSPDGQKIVFFSGAAVDGRGEPLSIMNIDDANLITLTHGSGHSSLPAWSPDGQQIACVVFNQAGTQADIHLIKVDGSEDVNLTQALSFKSWSPVWSPDGQKIAFMGMDGNHYDIYVINPAGTNPINLTNLAAEYLPDPTWSPDSQQIAYVDPFESAIYLVNTDGTNRKRVTPAPEGYQFTNVAWSPDGQRLAFAAWSLEVDQPHFRVFTVNPDGTNLAPLYDDDMRGGAAFAWSPDGRRLAFAAGGLFFNDSLYVVNADGSNLTRLTSKGITGIDRIEWGLLKGGYNSE